MLVERRKVFGSFIFGGILLALSLWMWPSCTSLGEGWEKQIATISVVLLIYIIFSWINNKLPMLSPSFVFIMAIYVLHLALVILVGYGLREYPVKQNVVLYSYSEVDAPYALMYSIWFIYVFATSILFMNNNKIIESSDYEESDYSRAGAVGMLLLVPSLPAMIVNMVQLINIRLTISYHDIYNYSTNLFGIPMGPFMNLFLPAIFYLLFSVSYSKKKFLRYVYCVILFYGIYMILTGAKMMALIVCISVIIMYNHYFGLKIGFKVFLIAYLIAKILVAVSGLRSDVGLGSVENTINIFVDNFLYNDPIISLLNELGGTILTPILVMYAVRTGGGYIYGQSYLFGPIGSILSGLRITDYFKERANVVDYLTDPARGSYINSKTYGMGGSVIGEWFLNFGWLGIILVPILAYAIYKFEKALYKRNQTPLMIAITYSTLISVIMYSRQYITDIFWIAFYRLVVCYIVEWFIFRNKDRN